MGLHSLVGVLGLLGALVLPGPSAAQTAQPASATASASSLAAITSLQLRKQEQELRLQFRLDKPARVEVLGNLPRQVLIVKFLDARPAFRDDQRVFLLNDPYVVGVDFEDVVPGQTWAKVRLRSSDLRYTLLSESPSQQVTLSLAPAPKEGTALTAVRVGQHQEASRVVLDLTGAARFDAQMLPTQYLVRLRNVTARLPEAVEGEDARVRLLSVEQDGEDTLVRVGLKERPLSVETLALRRPERLVLDFRPEALPETAPSAVTAAPARAPAAAPQPSPGTVSLDDLLDAESNPLIRANYVLAEREFREGNYPRAQTLFLRVFNTDTTSLLGIRAFFRAADAQYEILKAANATNYHAVITTYQSAIRAAEEAGYDSELIPRAFYQIARAYQQMDFNSESNVNYQILQERFPDNVPYAADSWYYAGLNHLALRQYDRAAQALQTFLEGVGDPALEAAARYQLGNADYNLRRFVESKRQFDIARKLDPDFPLSRPVLLFNMGEAYYENAEFPVARGIYAELLDRYPDRIFTQLVALRLGDFLREEGKEADALTVYRKVMDAAPPGIRMRAMLRIADILSNHPQGEDYQRAINLYDQIAGQGENDPIVEEALLRKALTQTLHQQNEAAIASFEAFVQRFPKSPFNRENIVRFNIEENLKSLVDRLFAAEEYWEVAKVYTTYRERYFDTFRFPFTFFQIGQSYQVLGLYDEAIGLYERVVRQGAGAMEPLLRYQQALAYTEKDNLGRAEEVLLKFIQDYEQDQYLTDVRKQLALVYFKGRRYEEALNAYRILVRDFEAGGDPVLEESIAEVYYQLGLVYKELGQLKNAMDAFQSAIANFHHPLEGEEVPDFIIRASFLVGDMLFEIGQDAPAIAAYEEAIARYPDHERAPWARYQIGLIYKRTGQDRKALDTFTALVDLSKTRPGELWESLARENQRDLMNQLQFRDYLNQ